MLWSKIFLNDPLLWKECLLITWGSSRGSISLILAMAFAAETHLVDDNHRTLSIMRVKYSNC